MLINLAFAQANTPSTDETEEEEAAADDEEGTPLADAVVVCPQGGRTSS